MRLYPLTLFFVLAVKIAAMTLDIDPAFNRYFKEQDYRGTGGIASIPLKSGECIWLMTETFVDLSEKDRSRAQLVHNAIAIDDGSGKWHLHWHKNNDLEKSAFFQPRASTEGIGKKWYWPNTGVQLDSLEVVIFGRIVETTASFDAVSKGHFKITGNVLIKIDNPEEPVSTWRIHVREIPLIKERLVVSTSLIKHEQQVYLYLFDMESKAGFLAKLDEQDLKTLSFETALALWSQGEWLSLQEAEELSVVLPETQDEQAVFWHAKDQCYYHIWHGLRDNNQPCMKIASAKTCTGPWLDSGCLPLQIPDQSHLYGIRYHEMFSRLTYATNHMDFYQLSTVPFSETVFWPRTFLIK